jgi:hypothetical protein
MTLKSITTQAALPFLILVAIVHLAIAWPGAGDRGVIAEEVQTFLHHYPKLLDERPGGGVDFIAPNDDAELRDAIDHGRDVAPRWVGTHQWPELAYEGRSRVWPVLVRGHQSALGCYPGILLERVLGGGIAAYRRASVLMGLALLLLVWGLARRVGLSRGWATVATIGCALSPGMWFFSRTGYAFELGSRVAMIAALFVAAHPPRLTWKRALGVGALFALALMCRATIATSLAPPLLLMLFHPKRWAGPLRVGGLLGVAGGIPIAVVGLALTALPFASGTAPAAGVELDRLAARTLAAPAVAWVQFAWVVDARVILSPIADGALHADAGVVRPLIGAAVFAFAVWRWWRGHAGEAERIFVGALVANALVGAWLYGDPMQFQLGMAIEPLFVLAVVQQISSTLTHQRAAAAVAAVLLASRAMTMVSLRSSEARSENPMLSARAQKSLADTLRADGIAGDDLITTAYDHVGVLETWTDESLRPIHAWRLLQAGGVPEDRIVARWNQILDARPACHVLITRAPSLVAGSFTDHHAVAVALERALSMRGGRVGRRRVFEGDEGGVVFELVDIAPCGVAR